MNIYVALIVVSVLSGFASAFIAKSKGKDPFTWFLIGVVLSVVGLIIVLLSTKSKSLAATSGGQGR
jgi:hypothetical protein